MTTQQDRDLRSGQMEAAAGRRARPGVAPRADRDPGQGGRIALDLPPEPCRQLTVRADSAAITGRSDS